MKKVIKINFRIQKKTTCISSDHPKISVKFKKDRTETVGGFKGTRYILKIRNHALRATESQKQCPSAFLRKGGGQWSESWQAYWSSSLFLPSIIKLSQTLWELWRAQNFGFRGGNYIMKRVRVVYLARDMPTGPPLHSYQVLLNYLKQYGSYGLHKISALGEKTT